MIEIIALFQPINHKTLSKTVVRVLSLIIMAMLAMSGRVTMLGISRWTEEGGSYRTIQRFFDKEIDWAMVQVLLVGAWFLKKKGRESELLLAGDTTVVTKAGKKTYGIGRYFSSLFGKPVKGIEFEALSVIDPKTGVSYPVRMEQKVQETDGKKSSSQAKKSQAKKGKKSKGKKKSKKRGRPKGSKNKNRRDVPLTKKQQLMKKWISETKAALNCIGIQLNHFVYDGAFGNNGSVQLVRRCDLHLISKLRCDSALYFPFEGKQKKRGANKKYGDKLRYDNIPVRYLQTSETKDGIHTDIYQMTMWHKLFADKLNIVIIHKTRLEDGKTAHVVLFSTDLTLHYETVITSYRLRFQIEFNFRDAKQFWGLEDFMNVKQRRVHNFANLAMLMVNVSHKLIESRRRKCAKFSVNDLKAEFRGRKYAREVLKLLPKMPNELVIDQLLAQITTLGGIHTTADA